MGKEALHGGSPCRGQGVGYGDIDDGLPRSGTGRRQQQAVLRVLSDEGPMTQQHLGNGLASTAPPSSPSATASTKLDEKSLLERRHSPTDRRAYLLTLTLTPAGRHTQQQGQHIVDTAERKLLDALDESEQIRTPVGPSPCRFQRLPRPSTGPPVGWQALLRARPGTSLGQLADRVNATSTSSPSTPWPSPSP